MKFKELKTQIDESIKSINQHGLPKSDNQNLPVILDIVKKINKTLVLEEVLELVLNAAINLTKSDRGLIVLSNENNILEYKIAIDSNNKYLDLTELNISRSIIENVFRTGNSKFIESAQNESNENKTRSIFLLELQTILCSPLLSNGNKVGVIYVDSKNLRQVNIKEITYTFEILAGQAATAIRNAQFYQAQINSYRMLQEKNLELIKAKEEAETSDKLKSEFLAQISHEIRTPIHILLSYSNLIKDELEEQNHLGLQDNFEVINQAGKRIIRTTDLILNMAEIQSNNYEYTPTNFSIYNDILIPIYEEYLYEVRKKKIGFKISKTCGDSNIIADKYSIYQIFLNIIDNAVKYTNEGEISVVLQEQNDIYLIVVKDTGIGISKEYLPHIFKPFTQEEQGYRRKYEGNGLGLALVKGYCELNSADIQLHSVKNYGTSVVVSLPNRIHN